MPMHLTRQRLINQKISSNDITDPAELVSWLGTVQAQDYLGGLWSVGLRLKNGTERKVEEAIRNKKIVRTWPMRGTLHFVNAEDARWILKLLTPRIISGSLARLKRIGLDEKIFNKSRKVIVKSLESGKILTREEIYKILEKSGIPVKNQLGLNIIWRLAQEGLICFGPKSGKKFTFVLLDEWIPGDKKIAGEEALAEIAGRYFLSRGPATLHDFAWWTGLNLTEATRAMNAINTQLESVIYDDVQYWSHQNQDHPGKNRIKDVYLLPGFDEYMVAYKDRSVILDPAGLKENFHGLVTPKIIIDGRIAGTWKREIKGDSVIVFPDLFKPQPGTQTRKIRNAIQEYSKFIDKKPVFA